MPLNVAKPSLSQNLSTPARALCLMFLILSLIFVLVQVYLLTD